MRKVSGHDAGKLYAMKVLKKATIVQKAKSAEHTRTERQVLEHIRQSPFLVTLHYAFQDENYLVSVGPTGAVPWRRARASDSCAPALRTSKALWDCRCPNVHLTIKPRVGFRVIIR